MNDYNSATKEDVDSKIHDKFDEPSMYKVLLHNDDYTTMDFVIDVLVSVFNKSSENASIIMLNVHKQGIGVCGIYTYDVAETKVKIVETLAREKDFPLKCTMEKD
ncbi:MAG: ATP-dependent Clp protease adapter ClpS [Desulfosarcina sp.]|nr:ATP-dependent Clp protease adapter ClpS [Desulfobacterales bacterium]